MFKVEEKETEEKRKDEKQNWRRDKYCDQSTIFKGLIVLKPFLWRLLTYSPRVDRSVNYKINKCFDQIEETFFSYAR
jgi:hypothetical protein